MTRLKFLPFLASTLTLLALCFVSAPATAQPSADGKTYTVNTTADGGPGSLRAAITFANGRTGTTIRFADDVVYLTINAELPWIMGNGTVIDGSPLKRDLYVPTVTGSTPFNGLTIYGSDCVIRGLYLNGFNNAIYITSPSARRNRAEGCTFGVRRNGAIANGNAYHIRIDAGARNNIIGGADPTTTNDLNRTAYNVSASANRTVTPIVISGAGTDGNRVQGNAIHLGVFAGVLIEAGAKNNVIGGSVPGAGNEITLNTLAGILVEGAGTDGNIIQGNSIIANGTNSPTEHFSGGIAVVGAQKTVIGGPTVGARNIISANRPAGVFIQAGGYTTVHGNYIGTNAAGSAALGTEMNAQPAGVSIFRSSGNAIGGTQQGTGNLISGNTDYGIIITDSLAAISSDANTIQGNRIGTNAPGMHAIPNRYGVYIQRSTSIANIIGGSPAATNLISGNSDSGVALVSSAQTQLSHNFIGTDVTGAVALSNGRGVVLDAASGNTIGVSSLSSAPSGGNRIAFNGGPGVAVHNGGVANQIRGNMIRANGALGIDLSATPGSLGVTANDPLDADTGANGFQNFPVITGVTIANGKAVVAGTFSSKPDQTYTLDFYGVEQIDSSGNGEGQVHLGATNIATNADGDASFSFAVTPGALSRFVTATATSTDGTSEFSNGLPLPPSVQFSAANYEVNESAGTATVTVTRSGSLSGDVAVEYTVLNGSATAGTDYASTEGVLNFASGVSTRTFTIPILNDNLDEANETARLILRTPTGAAIGGSPSQAILTIMDNDAEPTLSIGDASVSEGAAGATTTVTFTITLTGATSQQVTVRYGTNNGTAQQPADYTYSSGTLIFSPGQTSKTITVPITGDDTNEVDETFRVDLYGPINATIARGSGVGTIVSDEFVDVPGILISDPVIVEGTGGADRIAKFPVFLTAPSRKQVMVRFYTYNREARHPYDYAFTSSTITFAPGETRKFAEVSIVADSLIEGDETFGVRLIGPINGTLTQADTVATIYEDDVPLASATGGVATEGSAVKFTISLSEPSPTGIRIEYKTANRTATSPDDYVAASGDIYFAAGETVKTVEVATTEDDLVEGPETMALHITGAFGVNILRSPGIGTISDNEPLPTISVSDATVNENAGVVAFTVGLSTTTGQQITVRYYTSDGTARQPGDYSYATGTLIFAPGETAKTVTVPVTDDANVEAEETFRVNLVGAINATIARAQGIGSIVDNDSAG